MTSGIFRSISDNNSKRLTQLLRHQTLLKLTPNDITVSLATAIRQGRPECVQSLLHAGADANASDEEGKPMIYLLMETAGGDPAILKSLLDAKANPNKVTWNTQQTALHAAARRGFQVCVKHLVVAGAEIDRVCSGGYTALMYASREGHVTVVRSLLADNADPNTKNDSGESALSLAVSNGHITCAEELITYGADVNVQDKDGGTPLISAVKNQQPHIITMLLQAGASPNAQELLSGRSILHHAVHTGDIGLVTRLLNKGADPNVRDSDWQTPFLLAVNMNRRDMMEALLKAGCRITNTDRSFNTAMHAAAANGQDGLIPLLVEKGLSVDIKGYGGATPLMLAALGGNVDAVDMLLEYRADPSLSDRNNGNALAYASLCTRPAQYRNTIIKMLIRAGCNVNQAASLNKMLSRLHCDITGFTVHDRFYTPLEIAFIKADSAAFMMLLASGAELTSFQCDKDLEVLSYQSPPEQLSVRWHLLRKLKREKRRVYSLKELCRRPVLSAFKHNVRERVASLPISEQLKGFLEFSDLDDICARYEQEETPSEASSVNSLSRQRKSHQSLGGYKTASSNTYGSLPRRSNVTKTGSNRAQSSGKQRHSSGSGNQVATPQERPRRPASTSSTPLASPLAQPKEAFLYPPRVKQRSRSSRDARETITSMLHGTPDEYKTSGEITPKPLTLDVIEHLHRQQTSPKDDYESVNKLLYGNKQRTNQNSFQDRVQAKKTEIQDRIGGCGGVEDYITAEIQSITSAINQEWGAQDNKQLHKWGAMEDLKVSAEVDHGKTLPILTLNQLEISSIDLAPRKREPLEITTSPYGTQQDLLSPTSITSSSSSSNAPLTFPSGDPQLLNKYLRTQEKVVRLEPAINKSVTVPAVSANTRGRSNHSSSLSDTYSENSSCDDLTDVHGENTPTHKFESTRARQTSTSSYGSSEPFSRSRIPVPVTLSASRQRESSVESASSGRYFRRTKSFRH